MSRVSIAASQKPKPKETFKFLRRDEGRLSYSAGTVAESPSKAGSTTEPMNGSKINRERRDSKSLREAIAYDMRNAKSHDPLGEVVVAVPKKVPPPNRVAATAESTVSLPQRQQQQGSSSGAVDRSSPPRRSSMRTPLAKKPDWVGLDIAAPPPPPLQQQQQQQRLELNDAPPRREEREPSVYSESYSRGSQSQASLLSRGVGRGDEYVDERPRYGGTTPRRPVASRHADPEQHDAVASPMGYDRNYFRRPPYQRDYVIHGAGPRSHREEEELMFSLEQEMKSAQEEREHYVYAKQQLDRERQRFEAYRFDAQHQLDDERAALESLRARDTQMSQKDIKSAEERYKNVSTLLATERETNRRLIQENESLRSQLDDLTSTLRETQKSHKAEVVRMRRDVDSLTHRNAELLAMAKEQQMQFLLPDGGYGPSPSSSREPSTQAAPAVPRGRADGSSHGQQSHRHHTPEAEKRVARRTGSPAHRPATENGAAPQEEAAIQSRREQREREVVEQRRREEEEEEREMTRRREAAAAAKQQWEEADQKRESSNSSSTAAAANVAKPVDERKSSGHPAHTPRMQTGVAVTKRRPSAGSSHPPIAPKPRRRIPSREELIDDTEQLPPEDFPGDNIISQTAAGETPNKREVLYRSGKRQIHYANGTVKTVLPSGHTILRFTNQDVKCTFPSGKSTYWYNAAQTMHTQKTNGVQVFEFRATGQTEKHLPDGTKEILYPDNIFKIVQADGSDETFFPDGMMMSTPTTA